MADADAADHVDSRFRAVIFNVQGLPNFILRDDVKGRLSEIGRHVDGFDALGLIEAFTNKEALLRGAAYEHHFALPRRWLRFLDSGLLALTNNRSRLVAAEHFQSETNADQLASKGVIMVEIAVPAAAVLRPDGESEADADVKDAPPVFIDFVLTHMQAGDRETDNRAQRLQAEQLVAFLNGYRSPDKPLVFCGDLNMTGEHTSHYSNARDSAARIGSYRTLADEARLTDPFPSGKIDRFLYRDSDHLELCNLELEKNVSGIPDLSDGSPLGFYFHLRRKRRHGGDGDGMRDEAWRPRFVHDVTPHYEVDRPHEDSRCDHALVVEASGESWDVNRLFKGETTVLLASGTDDPAQAATGFRVEIRDIRGRGDFSTAVDMSKNSQGGKLRFLVAERDPARPPITAVSLWRTKSATSDPIERGRFHGCTGDINEGRGGATREYLYLCWKSGGPPALSAAESLPTSSDARGGVASEESPAAVAVMPEELAGLNRAVVGGSALETGIAAAASTVAQLTVGEEEEDGKEEEETSGSVSPATGTVLAPISVPTPVRRFVRTVRPHYQRGKAHDPSRSAETEVLEVDAQSRDINRHFGGETTVLLASWTSDERAAATGFRVVVQKKRGSEFEDAVDMAKGAKGREHRFLVAERDLSSDRVVTDVALWRTRSASSDPVERGGYHGKTADINRGRKGDYLYICWKTAAR
jgi:Endonuclease/Exonuclease/phosphatase family